MSAQIHRLLSKRRRSARPCTRRNHTLKAILSCVPQAGSLEAGVRLGPNNRAGAPGRPGFLLGTLFLVLLAVGLVNFWFDLCSIPNLLRIAITLFLMRVTVYFRDGYRATTYGVPDLVDIVRLLDEQLEKKLAGRRSDLSFIGHSMGAFVVTDAVRILTDVFSPAENHIRRNAH